MLVPLVRPISRGRRGIGKYSKFLLRDCLLCFILFHPLATLLRRFAGLSCPKLFNAPDFEDRTTLSWMGRVFHSCCLWLPASREKIAKTL